MDGNGSVAWQVHLESQPAKDQDGAHPQPPMQDQHLAPPVIQGCLSIWTIWTQTHTVGSKRIASQTAYTAASFFSEQDSFYALRLSYHF